MDFLVYVLFLWIKLWAKIIPLSLARKIAKLYGIFFYYIIPVRKKVALNNLKLCFPEKNNDEIIQILKGTYINVMTVIFEFFYMERLDVNDFHKQINISNPELITDSFKNGKGLILICAHFGNWEWMAYGASLICNEPFNVIVKEQTNNKIDKAITKIRESKGNKMITMKNSLRKSLSLLHDNKIVAMLGDQTAPKDNSVKVDFFVRDVPAFGGTAGFAIKTGCVLLFGVPLRNDDGTYSLTMQKIDADKYKQYNNENIKALTQEHVNLLKEAIIKRPDHWLWFHRRFKHVAN